MGKRTQTREREETDFSCKRLPEVGDSGVGGVELVEGILFSKKKKPSVFGGLGPGLWPRRLSRRTCLLAAHPLCPCGLETQPQALHLLLSPTVSLGRGILGAVSRVQYMNCEHGSSILNTDIYKIKNSSN